MKMVLGCQHQSSFLLIVKKKIIVIQSGCLCVVELGLNYAVILRRKKLKWNINQQGQRKVVTS